MKITFSGSAEEIAAAIRAVAGVGEVQIRVPEPHWRKMAEEVAQEMNGLAEKIVPAADAPAAPEPTEPWAKPKRIKRANVELRVGDEVRHAGERKWYRINKDDAADSLPLCANWWFNRDGSNPRDPECTVTHFRRNGITYTIED